MSAFPAIIPPKIDMAGARLMPVRYIASSMKPTLEFNDFILVVPVSRFDCDGLYVFEEIGVPVVRRAAWTCRGLYPNRQIALSLDAPGFSDRDIVTEEQFNANLLGQVAGILKMSNPHLIPGLMEGWL